MQEFIKSIVTKNNLNENFKLKKILLNKIMRFNKKNE